jgi:hypothetical protein
MTNLAIVGGFIGLIFSIAFITIGLMRFAKGVDHTVSLSNVQVILWTGVIAGTYIAMAILKQGFLGDINSNLLGLMGISAGSSVAAISIRTVQQPTIPASASNVSAKTRGLLAQEKKPTELSIAKLQMLTWTIVTLTIFVIVVASYLANNRPELPDIGSGLLVLMGISHSAYIGNKVADKPA